MSNPNAQIIGLLQAALASLEQSQQVLNEAKATAHPVERAARLRAAIAEKQATIAALKNAKFIYLNGARKIDDKFRFGFHKIIEQEPIDKQLALVDALENISECDAECLAALVESIFAISLALIRVELTADIRRVVGEAFNPTNLTLAQLIARAQQLDTIVQLRDGYRVDLIGSSGEPLGVWFSSPTANLSLIPTLQQAVETTANALQTEITAWNDPNTGYLRGGIATSAYLTGLRNAGNAAAAFRLVVGEDWLLPVRLAPTKYLLDATKLFGYLYGWDYAKFARRVIQIDRDIYQAIFQANVASGLWNSQSWSPISNTILRANWSGVRGFTNRNITSIDPVHSLILDSPYDFIIEYRSRTIVCTPEQSSQLCHENCYEPAVKNLTENVSDWAWAGTPRTSAYLPFLPSSILTGCVPARKSLARGTRAFWNEVGIFGDIEYLVRWVNALEHGTIVDSIVDENVAAQVASDLMEFLHFIYRSTTPNDRDIEYLAAQSSAILEYNNSIDVDERTYIYFEQLLTPVEQLPIGPIFANVVVELDWSSSDPNQYSTRIRNATANAAVRTFGSTEFDVLTVDNRRLFVAQQLSSNSSWVEFISVDDAWPATGYSAIDPDPKAPIGVFLLTADQFNFVQGLE
ncbi:MAG: hypothetical protein SF162_20075 [bacterium]|nr:hypothetical protein [bacterium]